MRRVAVTARGAGVVSVGLLIAGLVWATSGTSPGSALRTTAAAERSSLRAGTPAVPTLPSLAPSPPSSAPTPTRGGDGGPSASAPPAGSAPSERFEAEDLDGPARVEDPSASGGAAARTAEISAPGQVTPGTYLLRTSVKSPEGGRIDHTLDGAIVGSYQVPAAWTEATAVVPAEPPYK
jgi:hypothetical protein